MKRVRKMWICCQLGARENYAIARSVLRASILDRLMTDIWIAPTSFGTQVLHWMRNDSLKGRFHPSIPESRVQKFNSRFLAFELVARLRMMTGWERIIARNKLFQRCAINSLEATADSSEEPKVLFAYSYAALEILRYAKTRGWRTVLGQIDCGPLGEEILAEELKRETSFGATLKHPPAKYWSEWRLECELADHIIVNSRWSLQCLAEVGIPLKKLNVVPLAFETSERPPGKEYPQRFTNARPLRVLFLGQITLAKGVARIVKVAQALRNEPVEFTMVGPIQIQKATELTRDCRIHWVGAVSRNKAANFYDKADVFILPTLSDGFAITQLEAFAHRLPIIASRNCGQVVRHGVNGLLLEEPTPAAIESALRFCLNNPEQLAAFSQQALVGEEFSLEKLGQRLISLPA